MRVKRPALSPARCAISAFAPSASGGDHRADRVAAAEPAQASRIRTRCRRGPAPPSLGRRGTARRSARREACRAPQASSARSAAASALVAGRSRWPGSSAMGGDGCAMPWCCRTSPMRMKPRRSYKPRPSVVACSRTLQPSSSSSNALISRWPMRRPLAGRRDDDEPDRRVLLPPAPAHSDADDVAVALRDDTFAKAKHLLPVGGPMRPAHLIGERVRGGEIGRGHRPQRHAIRDQCGARFHRDSSTCLRALMLDAFAPSRQP